MLRRAAGAHERRSAHGELDGALSKHAPGLPGEPLPHRSEGVGAHSAGGAGARRGHYRVLSLAPGPSGALVEDGPRGAHWIGCSYVITRVAGGKADVTNSFALLGTHEVDKAFTQEHIEVVPALTEPS